MDIKILKDELLQGKLNPTYLFTGDELILQDIYIQKIGEIAGVTPTRVEALKDVYAKLGSKSFIKQRKIYVIRNDEDYRKTESVWQRVIEGKNQKDNIIILLYSNLDKRSKFYKQHQPILTEFNFVGEDILTKRVNAISSLPLKYSSQLVKMCGCNYGRILLELDKLKMLCDVNNYDITTAFLSAVKHKMIFEEVGDITFDFGNAIIQRNKDAAYEYKRKFESLQESPTKLLGVLYSGFRTLFMVQCTPPHMQNEEVLGLSKGQIWVNKQKVNIFTNVELMNIMKCIRDTEKKIKVGEIDISMSLDYVLSQIF